MKLLTLKPALLPLYLEYIYIHIWVMLQSVVFSIFNLEIKYKGAFLLISHSYKLLFWNDVNYCHLDTLYERICYKVSFKMWSKMFTAEKKKETKASAKKQWKVHLWAFQNLWGCCCWHGAYCCFSHPALLRSEQITIPQRRFRPFMWWRAGIINYGISNLT